MRKGLLDALGNAVQRALKLVLPVLLLLCNASAFAQAPDLPVERTTSQSQLEDFGEGLGAAAAIEARPIGAVAMALVKYFEGWSAKAYDDPAGYCTIGYGHLIALKPCKQVDLGEFGESISEARGLEILELDTRSARRAVEMLVKVDLSDEAFGALSSFVFNIGKGKFASSTLLKRLNEGEQAAAVQQFPRWNKAGGEVLGGLVTRRACEAAHFVDDLTLDAQGRFNPSQCVSLGAAPGAGDPIDIELGE